MQPSLPKVPFGNRTELIAGAALLAVLLLLEIWVIVFGGGTTGPILVIVGLPIVMAGVVIAVCKAPARTVIEPMRWKEFGCNILYWAGYVFLMLL